MAEKAENSIAKLDCRNAVVIVDFLRGTILHSFETVFLPRRRGGTTRANNYYFFNERRTSLENKENVSL